MYTFSFHTLTVIIDYWFLFQQMKKTISMISLIIFWMLNFQM